MYVPFSETKRNVNLLQRFAQPQTTSMVTVVHYMSSNRHDKHVKITSACVNIFTRSCNQEKCSHTEGNVTQGTEWKFSKLSPPQTAKYRLSISDKLLFTWAGNLPVKT